MKSKNRGLKTTKQRVTWGFNPVTRVVKSKKIYSRKRQVVSKEIREYL
jgi:hypothetical protein